MHRLRIRTMRVVLSVWLKGRETGLSFFVKALLLEILNLRSGMIRLIQNLLRMPNHFFDWFLYV